MNLCSPRLFWIASAFIAQIAATSFAQTPLVNHGDAWHSRKGTNAAQVDWKTAADASLDATWQVGNGGFGYADNAPETQLCQTILSDMRSNYSTFFMRKSIAIASGIDTNQHLSLTMDFDDGFIAFLDGAFLASANSPGSPSEPAFNALATASRESSHGNNAPQPPVTYDLGAVGTRLPAGTHVLAILGLNQNRDTSSDFIQIADLALVTNNNGTCLSGTIAANTTLYASNSPIVVCGNITIPNGVTLTIEAGTTVQLGAGVNIVVANGGILLAEGVSNAPIHFTHSGASGNWGNITVNGAVGSPETRITHAFFDSNANDAGTPCINVQAGTVLLDHLTFGNPGAPYIHVDGASFLISDCYFPTPTTGFEPCHGVSGVKSGGRGIFLRNFFGKPQGYNDVVDFTGSHRRSFPIVQFINNVVVGGDDDGFDIDGTDAWVEGNIFLHLHKNAGTPDSSSAVSGGNFSYGAGDPGGTGTETSQITVIRNIMFDCDEASDAKQGNFYTFLNNTIVHQSHVGGIDTTGAVVILADIVGGVATTEGRGIYLEGNIVYDAEQLTRNVTAAIVTFTNNILPFPWSGPGGDNTIADPLFKHVPQVSETFFTNWAKAQIMWDWLSLQTNSVGIGTGPNGSDKGAAIPRGVYLSGVPTGETTQTNATIRVGINRTGSGIPTAGFPLGSGYTFYKWRLDTNAWSVETPISTPITLSNLKPGSHYVEVSGKNDANWYQDDPALGTNAVVMRSATWTVASSLFISSIAATGPNSIELQFTAEANTGYTIEYRDDLSAGTWLPLSPHIDPINSQHLVTFPDTIPVGTPTRFYRLLAQ